jgi:Flp pilus assembly protein TadD
MMDSGTEQNSNETAKKLRAAVERTDWQAAAEAARELTRLGPQSASAHCNLGGVLLRLEAWDEAAAALSRELEKMAAGWTGPPPRA